MNKTSLSVSIASITLVIIGVGMLLLNIFTQGRYNIALPLVFLVLGGIFFIVVFNLKQRMAWAALIYIPAAVLTAFGIIFLLNVITDDWKSWAYAWLFLLTAIGIGLLLANQDYWKKPILNMIGWGLTLAGISFFALFGAISGGLFIQIMAPILLVVAGVSLRWLHLETVLPAGVAEKLGFHSKNDRGISHQAEEGKSLAESLSSRELEVLRLIGSGLSNQQIAIKLSLAPSTVKTHINNIYGKLGVQTRVQALNQARSLKLIDR